MLNLIEGIDGWSIRNSSKGEVLWVNKSDIKPNVMRDIFSIMQNLYDLGKIDGAEFAIDELENRLSETRSYCGVK